MFVQCVVIVYFSKYKFLSSRPIEDMSFENLELSEDTSREISEGSNLPENSIFIQEKNMEPIIRWIKAEIPEAPKEEFTQVRVTHIDENGQIYYHLYGDEDNGGK